MTSWTVDDVPDLTGRRALVTGATSGLGVEVVRVLAAHGAEVLMAGRDELRLRTSRDAVRREVEGARVLPLVLDLADQASVRRAAERAASHGPLHLLVNNAGVMAMPYARTVDGFELQLATNHLGPFALTGLLLPRLVESGDARVVGVSSLAHRTTRAAPLGDPRVQLGRYRPWTAYAQSKLAGLLFTFELDRRVREAGLPLRATAAHPGLASTALARRAQGGQVLDAALTLLGQPAALGAQPVLMAATADLPGSTYVGPGGPGEVRGLPQIVGTSRLARDPATARRLWDVSQQATGVRYP